MSAENGHFGRTAAGTPYDPRAARNVLIVFSLMALMVMYVETMVIPAFKSFVLFFDNAPATTVVWIVSAYLLVGTVATPIFGKLGDKYGKKQVLVLVMGLYAVAVALAGFSPNIGAAFGIDRANLIYVLIGIRAFQGLGMGMFPLAFDAPRGLSRGAGRPGAGNRLGDVRLRRFARARGWRLYFLQLGLAAHLPHGDPGGGGPRGPLLPHPA